MPPPAITRATASAICDGGMIGNFMSCRRARASPISGVSTSPGQTALIVMRFGASDAATLRTNPTTACLVSV